MCCPISGFTTQIGQQEDCAVAAALLPFLRITNEKHHMERGVGEGGKGGNRNFLNSSRSTRPSTIFSFAISDDNQRETSEYMERGEGEGGKEATRIS